MTLLKLPEHELRGRSKDVMRVLSPLVDRNRIDVRSTPRSRTYTIGVLPRGYAAGSLDNPSSIRAPTKLDGVYFNYYEVWVIETKTNEYLLDRAYLHLHLKKTNSAQDAQVLCLHCDPQTSLSDGSTAYRRGPHLHIMGAIPNIDRAHIALCLNDPYYGGTDVHKLTRTLESAVKMIAREIFPRYR